ncbi:MAG: SDR family oxidoreductase [Desulfovibrio sp.]|nr:MAG: SDR family oxidoreductase [Desulfovibrio sp.]
MKDFRNKVVVITGGATGIGFSLAQRFGEEGAKLVLAARREDRLQEAVSKLSEANVEARYFMCDVTKRQEVEALADFAWEAFGRADVIVNNAGMMLHQRSMVDTPLEDVQRIFNVNVLGVWNGSTVFGKRFLEQGTEAAIYNVGSENSLFNGVPMGAAYVMTKHSVLAITEALHEEMPDHVRVGLICPGFVRSELGPSEAMAMGMDTDKYTALAMQQIKNNEFFIVSHAYNMERINTRHQEISTAFERYAPRYDGDDEFDVRSLFQKMAQAVEHN